MGALLTTGKMEILKAKLEDRAAIIEVVNAAYAVETGCTGISFKNMPRYVVDSNQDGESSIDKQLNSTYVVHDTSGKIVGSVRAEVGSDDVVYIGPVAVAPKHQGQGLGSRLLSFAEGLAPVSQVDVVSCRSDLFPMYERRGYVEKERYPVEKNIPERSLTRKGLQFVL